MALFAYLFCVNTARRTLAAALLAAAIVCLPTAAAGDQSVSGDHFIYHFVNPAHLKTAQNTLAGARTRLIELVGDSLPYRPSVYIVDDLTRFNDLIGGKFPDWGAAAAFPERQLIAIKSPDHFNINRSLEELLAHEYSHLLLDHATGLSPVPRWFDEGMAMRLSMEWSWSDNLAMSKAAVFGQLIELSEIQNVNRFNEAKAHVAYAEAYLAVEYLIDLYGPDAVRQFVSALRAGADESEALYRTTGATTEEFESDFRLHLEQRFNIISLFMDTSLLWLGLAVIVIIGFFLRFRRRREFYRKWERQERLESTDFDYGDPDNPEEIDDDDESWRG